MFVTQCSMQSVLEASLVRVYRRCVLQRCVVARHSQTRIDLLGKNTIKKPLTTSVWPGVLEGEIAARSGECRRKAVACRFSWRVRNRQKQFYEKKPNKKKEEMKQSEN